MAGRGKRAQTKTSSEEAPAKTRQNLGSDWCADCMAAAQASCRGGHRVVDMDAARKDSQAALTAAHHEVLRHQAHLDALADARARSGPVLKARVRPVDELEQGWSVPGGSIRVAMATTLCSEGLTAEDQKAVCAALEGLTIEYEVDGTDSTTAHGDVADLGRVAVKLADCVEGQAARRGDVLLTSGRLEVFFRDAPAQGGPGVRMFGRVKSGLDLLEGRGCDGNDSIGLYGIDCVSGSMDCFCHYGGAGSTTLSRVKFVA